MSEKRRRVARRSPRRRRSAAAAATAAVAAATVAGANPYGTVGDLSSVDFKAIDPSLTANDIETMRAIASEEIALGYKNRAWDGTRFLPYADGPQFSVGFGHKVGKGDPEGPVEWNTGVDFLISDYHKHRSEAAENFAQFWAQMPTNLQNFWVDKTFNAGQGGAMAFQQLAWNQLVTGDEAKAHEESKVFFNGKPIRRGENSWKRYIQEPANLAGTPEDALKGGLDPAGVQKMLDGWRRKRGQPGPFVAK